MHLKDIRRQSSTGCNTVLPIPAIVPAKRSAETLATLPMTGEVTTATVMAAHFQLCSHAFATTGGKPAAVKTEVVHDSKKMGVALTAVRN